MTVIREDDFIQSVADALQFISYYHPLDYIEHLGRAYEREQSPAAKDAIAQILTNSRMCAEGKRPLCQDTGIVNMFLKVGMDVRWGTRRSLADMINEGVRLAYTNPDNKLRASVVDDPLFARKNTQGQLTGRVPRRAGPGRRGRSDRCGEGRRLREQVEVRDAQPERLDRRLGAEDGADDGCRLVPARHARHRRGRHGRKSHAAGEGVADGAARHARAACARTAEQGRRAAHRAVREGQRARHRRAGSRRAHDRARREAQAVSDARGVEAGRDDPELRRHAPRALRARWQRPRRARAAVARPVAQGHVDGRRQLEAGRPRHAHARRSCELEAGRDSAAERQDAHWTRRRAQAHRRPVRERAGIAARRRFHEPRDLLRRSGRSGARRSRGSCGPDDGDAHGQVHGHDAREDRPASS